MTPTPVKDLRDYVERVQSSYPDPAERDRALAKVEQDVSDILGTVGTYRNDTRLQMEARAGNQSGSGKPA